MEKIFVNWKENMAFEANVNGFKLNLDATAENGGSATGMTPKPLLLVALAGCTGMDIASLAKKMRVQLGSLTIEAQADKSETMPIVYTAMRLIYHFEAQKLFRDKIVKMVVNSQQKYCGVADMLRQCAPIDYRIMLGGVDITPQGEETL
ncbi:MAG: OsmC family protein [Mucinivorans sp.]